MWISRSHSQATSRKAETPLGPLVRHVAAPPDIAFDVVAAPYLGKTPRAMATKLKVIDRGSDLVVADHYTPILGGRFAVITRETVTFHPPDRIAFRLLAGPVAGVEEEYLLEPVDGGTRFTYRGTLWSNLRVGASAWARMNARSWTQVVHASICDIATEAERRHGPATAIRREPDSD